MLPWSQWTFAFTIRQVMHPRERFHRVVNQPPFQDVSAAPSCVPPSDAGLVTFMESHTAQAIPHD